MTGQRQTDAGDGAPSPASAYERRAIGPRPKAQPELKNVVIFFGDLPAAKARRRCRPRSRRRTNSSSPHLVAVTAGSTVAFPNEDPFFHNVFSLSRGAAFNLGRYPSGASRSKTFTRPGIVKVFCEIHSHMSAVIRVFDHRWFTRPDRRRHLRDRQRAARRSHAGRMARAHRRAPRARHHSSRRGYRRSRFTLPVLEPGQ